jgi:MFS family permease
VGTLTSALQLGFILGTLVFALLTLADRYPPRRVFLMCSLAGSACTVAGWWMVADFPALLGWRAATGFFLAGIYPVGMKIATQWFPKGLGAALGLLIGALVLGSASPHALRALSVIWTNKRVRGSVLGYFGHMWELYTMWVLVPLILATRLDGTTLSLAAFCVLGAGVIGCVGGGYLARSFGSARVAGVQLATSGLCCVLAPWLMEAQVALFGLWLLVWGVTVSGDSPQFSALTAKNAPPQAVGSVLTLTNCIGFTISVISIELFVALSHDFSLATLLPWLGLGPVLGLWGLWPLLREPHRVEV